MLTFLLAICIFATPMRGQGAIQIDSPDTAIGKSPFAAYDASGIDNVNPLNGNLFINIPLLAFPQRSKDLRLQFRIFSNDKGWMIHFLPYTTADGVTHYGTGRWFLADPTGVYVDRDQFAVFGDTVSYAPTSIDENIGETDANTTYISYFAKTADGSFHYLADLASQSCSHSGGGQNQCTSEYTTGYNTYPATDGSGYILTPSAVTSNGISFSLFDRDGITYSSGLMTDPNGNTISTSSSGWTDTVGRVIPGNLTGVGIASLPPVQQNWVSPFNTHAFDLVPGVETNISGTPCPAGANKARIWAVPLPPNTSGSYYLCYSQISYSSNFLGSFSTLFTAQGYTLSDSPTYTAEALTSIILPNNTSYTFTYDAYLSLSGITLPTGGSISYVWQTIPFWVVPKIADYAGTADAYVSAPVSRALKTRTVNPGSGEPAQVWTYHWFFNNTWEGGVPNYNKVNYSVVTDPMGNDTEHVIGGTDLNGNTPGTLVETGTNYYQGCSPNDKASDSTCSSTNSTLLKSDQYGLTPVASMGAQYGSNSYDAIANPAWKRTTTQTKYPAGSATLVTKSVTELAPPYGSCTVSSLGPVQLSVLPNPPPSKTTVSGCYQLDQEISTALYDFGSGTAGSLNKTETTNFLWASTDSSASAYAAANLLDLVSSRVVSDQSSVSVAETDYSYDEAKYGPKGQRGNLTSLKKVNLQGDSPIEHGFYDSNGQLTQTVSGRGYSTTVTALQCSGSLPQTITDAAGHASQYSFDCGTGVLSAFQNANDLASNRAGTVFTYDAMRNPTNIQYPDGGSVSLNYNKYAVPLVVQKTVSGAPDPNVTSSIQYDGFLRQFITTLGNGATSQRTYDLLGHLSSVENPHFASDTPVYKTTYVNDALGRVVETINPDGSKTWQCFNGLTTSQQPNCEVSHGSVTGPWVESTDEVGNSWQRISDFEGKLRQVVEPGLLSTTYTYTTLGDLHGVTQTGLTSKDTPRTRGFTYNSLRQLLTAQNPETGTICYGSLHAGSCTANGYDLDGNLVYKTDARGVTISYQYDSLNRLLSKSYANDPTLTASSCYQYDSSSFVNSASANLLGHVTNTWTQKGSCPPPSSPPTFTSNAAILSRHSFIEYDPMGRIIAEQQCTFSNCFGGMAYTPQYSYDLAGNMNGHSNGIGTLGFSDCYEAGGTLSFVASGSPSCGAFPPASGYLFSSPTFNATGQLTGALYGARLQLQRTYDSRLRITSETATGAAVTSSTSSSATVTITGKELIQ